MKKIYGINTTAGKRYAIGVFDKGKMLSGGSPKYYKTKKGAEKALKKFFGK